MDTAERQELVAFIQAANDDSASAEHLVLSNITDGWVSGAPPSLCLRLFTVCSASLLHPDRIHWQVTNWQQCPLCMHLCLKLKQAGHGRSRVHMLALALYEIISFANDSYLFVMV